MRQFYDSNNNLFVSYVGIGVNAPKFRPEVVVTATYTTNDERTLSTFLSNRVPREFDDKLNECFGDVLDFLRFGSERSSMRKNAA